jgi:hypothetical protein
VYTGIKKNIKRITRMKTLPLLYLILLSCLFLFSSLSLAQTNCTRYLGGEITCTSPGGYRVEAREHINGQTSYYDSNGNVGTVNQHPNGGVSITPTHVGSSYPAGTSSLGTVGERSIGYQRIELFK